MRYKDTYSELRNIFSGVPQGSKLGPILFLLYINDIPKHEKTSLALFADDTAILSKHKNSDTIVSNLNSHLDKLSLWFNAWKIDLNVGKTQAIVFSKGRKIPETRVKLNNQLIPWANEVEYLGLILDKKLTYKSHFEKIVKKFKSARAVLYPMLGWKSELSVKNKLLLYKSMLRPVVSYACQIFGGAADSHIKKFKPSKIKLSG